MSTTLIVRDRDCDVLHRCVLELESQGYVARARHVFGNPGNEPCISTFPRWREPTSECFQLGTALTTKNRHKSSTAE